MNLLMGIVVLLIVIVHSALGVFAWMRRENTRHDIRWLLGTLALSALASMTYLIPSDRQVFGDIGRGLLLVLLLSGVVITFGTAIINDMSDKDRRLSTQRLFWTIGGIWLGSLVLSFLISTPANAGSENWLIHLFDEPNASSMVMFFGLITIMIGLIGFGLYEFYLARLPEVANRALFWVVNTALLGLSLLLMGSGTDIIGVIGMIAVLVTLSGTTYALLYHMVFDIRGGIIQSLRTVSFVSIATALIFTGLYLAISNNADASNADTLILMATGSLIIAALLVPIRHGIELIIQQMTIQHTIDAAEATRIYGKQVTETVELDALVKEVIVNLNSVMRVRRSCLILFNSTFKVKDAVELLVMQPNGSKDKVTGFLSIYSPLYKQLAAAHKPVSQFDIEYSPHYRDISTDEQKFFHELDMSAYAPILSENALIGLLACGPMISDTAFYPRDLQLLMTFAQQTGIALRNARLLDDLKHLNKSMESLNRGLKVANDQLNKMDAVKTDFITIASHELRTPLAQVRGYTDILDAMNEQGLLDETQTVGIVGNLRKATERMEELIAAMLDVSQLDVNAMDLSLTDSPPETILRMAIEPLSDAINQRKLSLTARGLRGLPTIQADLQRLVQAFRNVIVNAIKFTPDGGQIEITATLEEAEEENGIDHVLISIKDTGVGINDKDLDLVFQKFFRAYDPSLHSTGTYKFMGAGPGLGLTIAKGVIEGHGGKIWAESDGHSMENYPGTTFHIRLPLNTPDDAKRVMTIDDESNREQRKETALKSPIINQNTANEA